MDFQDWSSEIQRMLPNYGQSMAASATKAFEAELIDRRSYLALTGGGAH